ncbi:MAG: flagellar hook-associated protein FlgK [Nitrospirota bacterium]
MSGISNLFEIGRSALFASQQALSVTGHNVANINTPGYARQKAVFAEARPMDGSPGQAGTGVTVTQIQRSIDTFLEGQLTTSHEQLGRYEVYRSSLLRIQELFGDANDQGIGARLNEFFNALQDVATSPSDLTARTVLLSKATTLSQEFNRAQTDLTANRQALDRQVSQTISEINDRASQIADLNAKIVEAENRGQNANDLRDQRTTLLNEIAERIEVSTFEDSSGSLSVFVGRGQVLISQSTVRELVGVASAANDGLLAVGYDTGGTNQTDISSLITSGRLKGLLDARDSTIPGLLTSLDKLAASLVNEVNQVHRLGYGLDGSTGNDFFDPLSVTAEAKTTNTGSASVGSGAITANSLLTFHDYTITFTSATAYEIKDATDGTYIKGNYAGTAITAPSADSPAYIITGSNDTLTVSVDGTASGTITLTGAASPGQAYTSGSALATELQTKINADATLSAAGKSVTVIYDTTTNRFVITSNSTASTSAVNVTGGTARATLGLSSGTSTAASGTYSSPQTFTLDGLSVTVTGTPAASDVFTVNSREDSAKNMAVSLTSGNKVAAATSLAGVPSDNATVLSLVALKSKSLDALDGTTFSSFYGVTAANLGATAQKADRDFRSQEIVHGQLETFRSEVSGVSLDEELVDLMQFQRAFEAASRLIVITDEMLQTLISLGR